MSSRWEAGCRNLRDTFTSPFMKFGILVLVPVFVNLFNTIFVCSLEFQKVEGLSLADGTTVGMFYFGSRLNTMALLSIATACVTLIGVVFAQINARIATLTLILQAIILIFLFAGYYRLLGLMDGGHLREPDLATALYFSIISWTTVGYGDITPPPEVRPLAAMEALLGYLYLSVIAATASRIKSRAIDPAAGAPIPDRLLDGVGSKQKA